MHLTAIAKYICFTIIAAGYVTLPLWRPNVTREEAVGRVIEVGPKWVKACIKFCKYNRIMLPDALVPIIQKAVGRQQK